MEGRKFIDPYGNEMWSITVIVGDEDGTYVDEKATYDSVSLKGYEPTT